MSDIEMTPEMLELVAARFKALAEPTRLRILSVLREGERTVSDLVDQTGLGQANVSKHLQLLHDLRYVERRREGLYTVYSLADEDVFALCDIVCGRIEREVEQGRALIEG
ncbi:MAG: metalloregulator ArsR/SmtB family transcription factor [Gemmatimonadota bacterium]|jgi:ArsR family transcriptional regulator